MDDFLVFDEVSKHFGALKAVNGVTLRIKQGEVFSLLGPSGCGKTTLLRLAAGFERPDGGKVLLGGLDMTALPPNRRPVNTVFQNYALFPHLTVAENIAFGPRAAGRPKKEVAQDVERMMRLVQLHDHAHKRPNQLSGGQKQRVAIARALINKPRVLLLDEPLAALDLKLRQRMLLELAAIHREVGATFIYVTHDQTEAMSLSDRIAVMNAGKVEQIGAPEDLYDRPATEFVASFIGDTNMLVGTVSSCELGRLEVAVSEGLSLTAASDASWASGSEVRMSVRPEHLRVSREMAAAQGQNPWRAQLQEAIYLGATVRCWLNAGVVKLCADLPASGGEKGPRGWKVGETLWVTVDPADVNVVNRPEELMV